MGSEKADCLKKLTCHLQFKINGFHFPFLSEVWPLSFSRSFWELASLGSLLSATGAQHINSAGGKAAQGALLGTALNTDSHTNIQERVCAHTQHV